MPDIGSAVGSLLEVFGPAVSRAISVLVRTTLGLIVLGLVLAGASYFIAADGTLWKGILAAVIATIAAVAIAVFAGIKRAIGGGLLSVLGNLKLGERLVETIFRQLLKGEEDRVFRDRGVAVARAVERVPLAEASQRLETVVNSLLAEQAEGSGIRAWIFRKMKALALERIHKLTLTQFREADAKEGGVDLVLVKRDLAGRVDQLLAGQIEAMLNKVLALAVCGIFLISLSAAFALRYF